MSKIIITRCSFYTHRGHFTAVAWPCYTMRLTSIGPRGTENLGADAPTKGVEALSGLDMLILQDKGGKSSQSRKVGYKR